MDDERDDAGAATGAEGASDATSVACLTAFAAASLACRFWTLRDKDSTFVVNFLFSFIILFSSFAASNSLFPSTFALRWAGSLRHRLSHAPVYHSLHKLLYKARTVAYLDGSTGSE